MYIHQRLQRALMSDAKLIDVMDVHQATISVAVSGFERESGDGSGFSETKAETILQFIRACVAVCT